MKRKLVIGGFASASLLLGALSTHQFLQLKHRTDINNAVAKVPPSMTSQQFENRQKDSAIELQFAQASALLNGGNLEQAEKTLATLIQQNDKLQLANAARFNLANGYLREALNADRSSGRYRSLVELAKQRYRDLLAQVPNHWDARYNLEMALRLSPETDSYEVDERGKPIKSVKVVFPGFEARELP